jgi:hypothetical protein
MKTGDHVFLSLCENANEPSHWVLKELLIEEDGGIFAITGPASYRGWPERLRLRPERIEALFMSPSGQARFFYQDDVVRPESR